MTGCPNVEGGVWAGSKAASNPKSVATTNRAGTKRAFKQRGIRKLSLRPGLKAMAHLDVRPPGFHYQRCSDRKCSYLTNILFRPAALNRRWLRPHRFPITEPHE